MKIRPRFLALVALVALALGFATAPAAAQDNDNQSPEVCYDVETYVESRYSKDIPAVEEVSHIEYRYEREVPTYVTEYQFKKQTKTTVKHGKRGDERVVSDWSWWSPASIQWSSENVDVLQSGNHATWTEWHVDGFLGLGSHTDYFERVYRYFKTGETRQVQSGTITESFPAEGFTTDTPEGDGWTVVGENKVVTTEAVPGYTVYYVSGADPSLDLTDANYTTDDVDLTEWTLVDERDAERQVETECPPPPTTEPPVTTPPTTVPERVYECTDANGIGFDYNDPTDGVCEAPEAEDVPVEASSVAVLNDTVEAEELAFTGSDTVLLVIAGLALVGIGGALLVHNARKEQTA